MGHSRGYRRGTRHSFQKKFKTRGYPSVSEYLREYSIGEYVDIKVNGTVHKGMPYKYYHGRTGRIWNITPKAVGVEVYKPYRGRIYTKRIHVRIEHVQKSKCNVNKRKKCAGPRKERILINKKNAKVEEISPVPFVNLL